MLRQYLTTRQVAKLLGVSINTVYRWLKAEKIAEPYRNPENNYRLWTVEDIQQMKVSGLASSLGRQNRKKDETID